MSKAPNAAAMLASSELAGTGVGAGVVGVGVDAVDVPRFRRILERRPGFAARFAAKEAVMKALGTGLGGFALTDVEVRRAGGTGPTRDAPSLVLHRAAAAVAERRGVGPLHLSLTHTTGVAIAFVVAERSRSCSRS